MGQALKLALPLLCAQTLGAHRLDEYLQAALVLVAEDHAAIDLSLTPGVEMLPALLARVDTHRDGTLSREELSAYAAAVPEELAFEIDGVAYPLALIGSTFPTMHDLQGGLGTVVLRLRANFPRTAVGQHTLVLRNQHMRAQSVYLMNALAPPPGIEILTQQRDKDQTEIRIHYRRGTASTEIPWHWPLGGLVVVAAVARYLLGRAVSANG